MLAAGVSLEIPSPQGTRRFVVGEIPGTVRAEDGWVRTAHLRSDLKGHVYLGPAAWAELSAQAAHLLAHPEEMAARIERSRAAARAASGQD